MADRPFRAHVWAACSMRAMPENEKPPAMPVDIYFLNLRCILCLTMTPGDSPRRGEAPAPHLKQAKPVPLGAGFDPSPLSTAASKMRFTFCGTRLWKRGPGPRSAVTPADGSAGRLAPGTIGFPPCPRNRPPERPGPEPAGVWTRHPN